ncbi:MAG: aminotransferase class I/II-fold pyridoxal phosphate-dependent enzyme [Acidimicrobiales bacterium]|jgi:dTDP-4-amino-4,6-dideoxygalactose transaminase
MPFRIYLSPPDVGDLEKEYVTDAIGSGWVAPLGPHVDAFESEIAAYVGVEHAVALSSGTAGLHLALLAIGVGAGDDVVVPTMTFGATAFAVTYVGARPVLLDSEPQSWNLDPDLLGDSLARRAAAGRLPAAVIAVDVFGQTADYDRIIPLCAEYGVPLIEDAAEALGATHGTRMAGSFGRAAVFSFNGNKIMTTSGGGILVTNDGKLAERVRYLSTQARQPVAWFEHEDVGYNYRLSNVLAALGRAQLIRLPEMIERRRAHREHYTTKFQASDVRVIGDAPWGASNAWLSIALFEDGDAPLIVREALCAREIEARPVWKPMHRQPVFANADVSLNGHADDLFHRGLCLPSGSAMAFEDCDLVGKIVVERGARG